MPKVACGTSVGVAFQDDVRDMYAENVLSAARATVVMSKARGAGVKIAVKAIEKSGVCKKFTKNVARNLRRRLRRHDEWLDSYWFDIWVWYRMKDEEITKRICIAQ